MIKLHSSTHLEERDGSRNAKYANKYSKHACIHHQSSQAPVHDLKRLDGCTGVTWCICFHSNRCPQVRLRPLGSPGDWNVVWFRLFAVHEMFLLTQALRRCIAQVLWLLGWALYVPTCNYFNAVHARGLRRMRLLGLTMQWLYWSSRRISESISFFMSVTWQDRAILCAVAWQRYCCITTKTSPAGRKKLCSQLSPSILGNPGTVQNGLTGANVSYLKNSKDI